MFQRYAVYYTPTGDLATRGAAWLGWSIAAGEVVAHPDVPEIDVASLTRTPHRYGLHGTIKPPFYLAPGRTEEDLVKELEALCSQLPVVTLDGLQVSILGGFIALTPIGSASALADLAAEVVMELDHFRAEPGEAELARRRKTRLSQVQEKNLNTWGYPYVMDEFRFHITLTGRVKRNIDAVAQTLQRHFAQHLPVPFIIDNLTLAGQDDEGMFHEIHRFSLSG